MQKNLLSTYPLGENYKRCIYLDWDRVIVPKKSVRGRFDRRGALAQEFFLFFFIFILFLFLVYCILRYRNVNCKYFFNLTLYLKYFFNFHQFSASVHFFFSSSDEDLRVYGYESSARRYNFFSLSVLTWGLCGVPIFLT